MSDLTDEQVDKFTHQLRRRQDAEGPFNEWLVAVEARAARRERERIAAALEAWADTIQPTSLYHEGRRDAAYRATDIAARIARGGSDVARS